MDSLTTQAADLVLHAHTPLPAALNTAMSEAKEFFGGKSFAAHVKHIEARAKLSGAVLQGINAVVISIGMLGRALSRR